MTLTAERIEQERVRFNSLQNIRYVYDIDYSCLEIFDNEKLVATWNCDGDAKELLQHYKDLKFSGWLAAIEAQEIELNKLKSGNDAFKTLISECTQDGELDSRLFNSYIEHYLKVITK